MNKVELDDPRTDEPPRWLVTIDHDGRVHDASTLAEKYKRSHGTWVVEASAYGRVVAERDRLRADMRAVEDGHRCQYRTRMEDAEAERDRLKEGLESVAKTQGTERVFDENGAPYYKMNGHKKAVAIARAALSGEGVSSEDLAELRFEFETAPRMAGLERRIEELEAELDEAHERIEELEHELDTQTRDNDGFVVIDGVYEELD
jgi:hypothetical protein